MISQQPQVKHIRVGDEDVGRLRANLLAPRRRGVAVVDSGPDLGPASLDQASGQLLQTPQLVLLQGLQGEDEEGLGLWVGHYPLHYGQPVDERLARGGGRGHDGVPPLAQGGQGLGLMRVEPLHSQPPDRLVQGRVQIAQAGRLGGDGLQVGHLGAEVGVIGQGAQKDLDPTFWFQRALIHSGLRSACPLRALSIRARASGLPVG